MLPQKQKDAIWETANKLYPTFNELLGKVREMVQDSYDKGETAPMDIDHIDDSEPWTNTGQCHKGRSKGQE